MADLCTADMNIQIMKLQKEICRVLADNSKSEYFVYFYFPNIPTAEYIATCCVQTYVDAGYYYSFGARKVKLMGGKSVNRFAIKLSK
jgi:late competence protein required for DNA uptake (superfamily II DNA/RNA helicase)